MVMQAVVAVIALIASIIAPVQLFIQELIVMPLVNGWRTLEENLQKEIDNIWEGHSVASSDYAHQIWDDPDERYRQHPGGQ